MAASKRIGLRTYHYRWSRDHKPALSIDPGDSVTFRVNDVSSWQITEDSTPESLVDIDPAKLYPLAGPVYVRGARPGDTLLVEVLSVSVEDFGWSTITPGFGLLEEFARPYIYKWDLRHKGYAPFERGIKVPLRPFCGVMGVAPSRAGSFDVMPPGRHGGNIDIRHLTVGSALRSQTRPRVPRLCEGTLRAGFLPGGTALPTPSEGTPPWTGQPFISRSPSQSLHYWNGARCPGAKPGKPAAAR